MKMKKKSLWFGTAVLLMALLCTGLLAQRVLADETEDGAGRFNIVCRADDSVYIGSTIKNYPVELVIRNDGADFDGVVKLMLYSGVDKDTVIAYGQSAVIPSGETVSLSFRIQNIIFDIVPYDIPVRVDLLDENGLSVCSQSLYLTAQAESGATITVGVTGQDTRLGQVIDASEFDYESYYVGGRVTMKSVALDSGQLETLDMSRLGLLILEEDVSDQAWENISDWLMAGGRVMLTQKVYDQRIGKPLDEEGMASWGTGRVLVDDMADMNGTRLIQSVQAIMGDGMLYKIIGGDGDDYWVSENLLSYDLRSPRPRFGGYLMVLLLYIALLGPAAYLFLKKRDRREYLWGVIPCLAVVFSLLVWQFGGETRYTGAFLRYDSILELTEEGTVERTWMALTSPDRDSAVLALKHDCELTYLVDDYAWNDKDAWANADLMKEDYDLAIAPSEDKIEILMNGRTVFDQQYFSYSRIDGDSSGGLDASITYAEGCFSGEITNRTPWDLKNLFVFHKGVVLIIGDLGAGESLSLDRVPGQRYAVNDRSVLYDTSVYGEGANETAAGMMMNGLIGQTDLELEEDQTVICGFTEDYGVALAEGSQMDTVSGLTLVMQDMAVSDSGDDWKTEVLVRGTGVSEEDENNFDAYTDIIYGYSEIQLIYQLEEGYTPSYLQWLGKDASVRLEFYNLTTDTYDRVMEDTDVMTAQMLSPYLSDSREIRARVTAQMPETTVTDAYVPAFTVTGGVSGD